MGPEQQGRGGIDEEAEHEDDFGDGTKEQTSSTWGVLLMEQPGPGQAVKSQQTTANMSNDLKEKVETSDLRPDPGDMLTLHSPEDGVMGLDIHIVSVLKSRSYLLENDLCLVKTRLLPQQMQCLFYASLLIPA
ncbi:hypothetical protein TREES_T100002953 [Tupaia chinensis]|uniref:Uncharacterized protein n=1 Tax=Tupaia chinensis TaxID=246437 RepID=L9KQR7_TUPCH|nr:hypothetical protein TREES_T100002953 [Tupaia chinensis]